MSEPGTSAAYLSALQRSLASLEEHVASTAGQLEKLRYTNHQLVAKMVAVDDLANQVEALAAQVENTSRTLRDLIVGVSGINETLRDLGKHWVQDSADMRRRLTALERAAE